MFTRRMLPVSILLTLVLTLMVTASVSAQEADLGGEAVFRDADAASDSLVMNFSDVPALAESSAYEGWLIDSARRCPPAVPIRSRADRWQPHGDRG